MVFFTCNTCNESLKKNQVEKHYTTKCRNCAVVTCVDCMKDFPGDSFKEHTSCMTEQEKYNGKDFKPKPGANKGQVKQSAWTERVQRAIAAADTDKQLRAVLRQVADYDNVPRKKAKFENFLKNSVRVRDVNLITRAWDLINAELTPGTNSSPATESAGTSDNTDIMENDQSLANGLTKDSDDATQKKLNKRERKEERQKLGKKKSKTKLVETTEDVVVQKEEDDGTKKSKKRKRNQDEKKDSEAVPGEETPKKKKKHSTASDTPAIEEGEAPASAEPAATECVQPEGAPAAEPEGPPSPAAERVPFKWERVIVRCLRAADGHQLALKKLKKKVMNEFRGSDEVYKMSEEKASAKFMKKISRNPRYKFLKDRVTLLR